MPLGVLFRRKSSDFAEAWWAGSTGVVSLDDLSYGNRAGSPKAGLAGSASTSGAGAVAVRSAGMGQPSDAC
jgi:hypothetical protein